VRQKVRLNIKEKCKCSSHFGVNEEISPHFELSGCEIFENYASFEIEQMGIQL